MQVTPKTEAQLKRVLGDCYFRLSEHPRKNEVLRMQVRVLMRDMGWDPDEVLKEVASGVI